MIALTLDILDPDCDLLLPVLFVSAQQYSSSPCILRRGSIALTGQNLFLRGQKNLRYYNGCGFLKKLSIYNVYLSFIIYKKYIVNIKISLGAELVTRKKKMTF